MKKIINLALFLLLFIPVFSWAQEDPETDVRFCPYKETVVIKDAPPGTKILALSADKLTVKQQGVQQFTISNRKIPCDKEGTAIAKIGVDDTNYTVITFRDGPGMLLELESAEDHGNFNFSKWHPDFGRHYYELYFISSELQ